MFQTAVSMDDFYRTVGREPVWKPLVAADDLGAMARYAAYYLWQTLLPPLEIRR
ncbi:hypothetical protein GCM10025857_35560 [Alicyclobacillus contaminans]|nr:hypothetical protein GCM10025857_35560 [Alicyclobacillus contaminans]